MTMHDWDHISEYRSAFISKPSTYFEVLSPKSWNGEPHVLMSSGGVHSRRFIGSSQLGATSICTAALHSRQRFFT